MAVLHIVFLVYVYSWSSDKEITSHNLYFQPFLVQLFFAINLPSIILTGLIFYPFSNSSSSLTIGFYYAILIIISCIQWLLIGYLLSKAWNFVKGNSSLKESKFTR
jgi:hypothetical protein